MSKEQEDLRQKFINETKSKLWLEDFTQEAGFSDAYVDWLEKQLLLYNVVGKSEQLVCDCGNKLTDKEIYFGQCLQCDKNVEEAN